MRIPFFSLVLALPICGHAQQPAPLQLGPPMNFQPEAPNRSLMDGAYSVVNRGGILYKMFSTSGGDFYVIHDQPLSRTNILAGECLEERPRNKAQSKSREPLPGTQPGRAAILSVERKLPASDWSAYGALIQETATSRCSQYRAALAKKPNLEIGVKKSFLHKDGNKTDLRVFNRGLLPNLNLGVDF